MAYTVVLTHINWMLKRREGFDRFSMHWNLLPVSHIPRPREFIQFKTTGFRLVFPLISVEHKSRADFAPEFAPEFKLPLSKLTATDNIMLGNHDQ